MNLGSLQLCRDDLRRIADLVRSLPGVRIDLEADNVRLNDVDTDLANLGHRLSCFTLKAYRETGAKEDTGLVARTVAGNRLARSEILSLRFAESGCTLAATNPGPHTSGVMCRRAGGARAPREFGIN
jgi:hypothetical protein